MPRYVRPKSRRPRRKMVRKTNKSRTQSRVPRGLTPGVYRFKRDIEEVVSMNLDSIPEGWYKPLGENTLYRQLAWSIGSLPNSSEFTSLFGQYRLKGARMKMYFSNTDAVASNSQLLVRMAPNQSGQVETLNQAFWQQIQAKRYRTAINGGRPLDIYMPLKQANEITSSTGTANTIMSPKWVNTDASNVQHYGINISIGRADGQTLSTNLSAYQSVRVITTIYLECRRVE